jgi:hypothetical protein
MFAGRTFSGLRLTQWELNPVEVVWNVVEGKFRQKYSPYFFNRLGGNDTQMFG